MSVDARADRRRAQLAESALATLSERGYSATSVRDIAQQSDFSHGVLHYYFKDKTELILEAVRLFKVQCVAKYDVVIEDAETADELFAGFCGKLVDSVLEDGRMHRLWYDVRAEGVFDDALRQHTAQIDRLLEDMVGRVLARYCDLAGVRPLVSLPTVYALLDGLFQRAIQDHFLGDPTATDTMVDGIKESFPLLVTPA